jgi:predicted phosphodiesterase
MTVWAILSDTHSRRDRLSRVLADARAQAAERTLSLGDVGSASVIELLDATGAIHVFGNWEASGLRGLPQPYRSQVSAWPARYAGPGFLAAHASPVWPVDLTVSGVVEYLRVNRLHWTDLFPSLQRSSEARWAAFAELELEDISIFFHGHTHIQEVWHWPLGGAPAPMPASEFETPADGSRWLVGVGSVGDAHDGSGACYALYDDVARRVTLRRV